MNINQVDNQYKQIIHTIDSFGVMDIGMNVRPKWVDGTPAHTKSWLSQFMTFDGTEVPILTTKKVAWKTAIKELLWIWQMKSNRVQDLRDMGVNIWDDWQLKDGTIGKAYGYQLGKQNRKYPLEKANLSLLDPKYGYENVHPSVDFLYLDQVDYLIQELKNNPASRRHITTLWNPDDLDEMALTPCVYETQWHVKQGKLYLDVRCRSNDVALGMPFNIFQYYVLQRMIAQVTGYQIGTFSYYIGDVHIYDRHLEPLREQMNREMFTPPTLNINPYIDSFYDFTIDDFELVNYKHGEKTGYEVAI